MSNTEALARAVIHARDTYGWSPEVDDAIEALRAALAQPAADVPEARFGNMPAASEQPVAYSIGRTLHWHEGKGRTNAQLYAAPQPAPARVPLTDAEIDELCKKAWRGTCAQVMPYDRRFARAIEAAHGITAKEGAA